MAETLPMKLFCASFYPRYGSLSIYIKAQTMVKANEILHELLTKEDSYKNVFRGSLGRECESIYNENEIDENGDPNWSIKEVEDDIWIDGYME